MGIRECGLWLRHSRMAVAGFDDIVTLRDVSPVFTTVRVAAGGGRCAGAAARLDDGSAGRRVQRVSGTVVPRVRTPRLPVTA